MVLSLNKSSKTQSSGAEIVDGHLVLSLLNAKDPKVWRMALDKIGNSTFELKTDDKQDVTKLILKPKKGTAEIIATYNTRDDALNALTSASNALQHKQTKPSKAKAVPAEARSSSKESANTARENGKSKKWLFLFIGFIAVILLYIYMQNLIPMTTIGFEQTSTQNTQQGASGQTTGIPLSADDFLNGM